MSDTTDSQLPAPAHFLVSLARTQLSIQNMRSTWFDRTACGMILFDIAYTVFVMASGGAYHLWIASAVVFCLSVAVAARVLRLGGHQQSGPSIAAVRAVSDEQQAEEMLVNGLSDDIRTNQQLLARRAVLFDQALIGSVLAVFLYMVGRLI